MRRGARAGTLTGPTSSLAPGFVQGNLVVVPTDAADAFARFCAVNPQPCPVLGVTEAGVPHLPALGKDIDLRTDLPPYRVWHNGALADEITDVTHLWRHDLVGFILGCSFTFEHALTAAGIPLAHRTAGRNVAMYRTTIACEAADPFAGPLVVSMRPIAAANVARTIAITERFPEAHGAPVHVGDPAAIGISDLSIPDYGDPSDGAPGDVPMFWEDHRVRRAQSHASALAVVLFR